MCQRVDDDADDDDDDDDDADCDATDVAQSSYDLDWGAYHAGDHGVGRIVLLFCSSDNISQTVFLIWLHESELEMRRLPCLEKIGLMIEDSGCRFRVAALLFLCVKLRKDLEQLLRNKPQRQESNMWNIEGLC